MRGRAPSLLIPTSPPLALGIVVAVALIAAQTLVVLRAAPDRVPEISLGAVASVEALLRAAREHEAIGSDSGR
jgi:hypothetical protein